MTEVELLELISTRGERIWSLVEWWSSVSFAVMAAAYLGSGKLNRTIISLITIMYTVVFLATIQALGNQFDFVATAYEQLADIAASESLGIVSNAALERQGSRYPIEPVLLFGGYFFTIGFMIYCYKKLRGPAD